MAKNILTNYQWQVLKLVHPMVGGLNFKETANKLGVKVQSVKRCVKRILVRLPEHERSQLIMTSTYLMYQDTAPKMVRYSPNHDGMIRRKW
jgi:DNA-binding NarL/FixJ family response regulator